MSSSTLVFKLAIRLLAAAEKRQGVYLIFLTILMGLAEMVGVASVVPFLAVMGDPAMVEENALLNAAYNRARQLGVNGHTQFIFFLGGMSFLMIVGSAFVRIVTHHRMNKFIEFIRLGLSNRLFQSYLSQPYAFFLGRHSGELSKTILSEVSTAIGHVYQPGISFLAHGMVLIFLACFLLYVDPLVAAIAATIMGGLYFLIFALIRGRLASLGEDVVRANKARFVVATEAFGGIKHIKLMGLEGSYADKFRLPAESYGHSEAVSRTLYQIPSFLIEAIVFGMMLILTLTLMVDQETSALKFGQMIPVLGVYAMASLRMKPAMQALYQGFASFRYGKAALEALAQDLDYQPNPQNSAADGPRLPVRQTIEISNLSFKYSGSESLALDNINVIIPVGSSIGIVGQTGSGKTTLLDLFLGLLEPTAGCLKIDGEDITERNVRSWQNALGYVPQEVYLTDSSLIENIALGECRGDLDFEKAVECAKLAQLHDFIANELPGGYESSAGERGVRLSGGQKQRVGIARALYHSPDIIVFDEATSSLDSVTEKALIDALQEVSKTKTTVTVAHRLTTVRHCDQIFVLDKGKVLLAGTYDELMQDSKFFQDLAGSKAQTA